MVSAAGWNREMIDGIDLEIIVRVTAMKSARTAALKRSDTRTAKKVFHIYDEVLRY